MSETYGNNKIFKKEIAEQLQLAGHDVIADAKYKTLFGTFKKADAVIYLPVGNIHPEKVGVFARYQHVNGSMLEKMPFLIDSVINAIKSKTFDSAIVVVDGEPLEALEDYYKQKMSECSSLHVVNNDRFSALLNEDFFSLFNS